MPGKQVTPRQWERYEQLRQRGWNRTAAAREIGVDPATAWRREKARNTISPSKRDGAGDALRAPAPIPFDELREEARVALEDFGFFQRRYFGRIATPWQQEAAGIVRSLLETSDREYAVVNVAPGSGKSTTFTHDIPAWLTCRNRAIRGQMGSKVESSARRYVQRLRRSLEATVPMQGEAEAVHRGLALDAVATLADDFGAFRPADRDLWSAAAFVVAQHDGRLIDEKEPTWSAFGMDSGFLGMRYDFIVWDDLVDKLVMRTAEARENQQEWWDDVAEKRLEPGGLLLLQGQRMGADDLYRYALDKRVVLDEDDDPDSVDRPAKYHHIVFKAHYEDRCEGLHKPSVAVPYPDGCLLDPRRLPWRDLKAEMANPRNNFAVIYQQEDSDPSNVLADPLWVKGGTDPKTGQVFVGCWDNDRSIAELPSGLFGDLLSVATADPSPTRFWSVQWWIVRCVDGEPQERYLMDLLRQKMDAPSFLDWHEPTRSFSGVMDEWQRRSVELRLPIRYWIVEANAAQKFMLQYEHMRRWLAQWKVDMIPHQTHKNKSDPDYGVQTMGAIYRHGLVRLPGMQRTGARLATMKLVEEATHWPDWSTDDCVMAQWFLEWSLPNIAPAGKPMPRLVRPSWMRKVDTYSWRESWRAKVG